MGRARSRGLPRSHKGRLIYDDIGGWFYGERSGKLFKRRGLNVSKENYDSVTDDERDEAVRRRLR